jgi:AcrR family transcriptional regulator
MSISQRAAPGNPADPQPFEPLTAERRRAMTRRHLLEAAAVVFAREGFHGATLDAVAAAAGFTKGAVYSNWRSKDDLFVAVLDDRIERQLAVVGDVLEGPGDAPGPSNETSSPVARVAQLLESGAAFWDDTWAALYLEFVVYARRSPHAQAKLADASRRSRALVGALIEHARAGDPRTARYTNDDLAEISLALFEGLAVARLIDADAMRDGILDTVLAVLGDATDARAVAAP